MVFIAIIIFYIRMKELNIKILKCVKRHLTNSNSSGNDKRCLRGSQNHSRAIRPLCDFTHPHLGQGSMLRIALLPAPNVSYLER